MVAHLIATLYLQLHHSHQISAYTCVTGQRQGAQNDVKNETGGKPKGDGR